MDSERQHLLSGIESQGSNSLYTEDKSTYKFQFKKLESYDIICLYL